MLVALMERLLRHQGYITLMSQRALHQGYDMLFTYFFRFTLPITTGFAVSVGI